MLKSYSADALVVWFSLVGLFVLFFIIPWNTDQLAHAMYQEFPKPNTPDWPGVHHEIS